MEASAFPQVIVAHTISTAVFLAPLCANNFSNLTAEDSAWHPASHLPISAFHGAARNVTASYESAGNRDLRRESTTPAPGSTFLGRWSTLRRAPEKSRDEGRIGTMNTWTAVTSITRAPAAPTDAQGHFAERIVNMVTVSFAMTTAGINKSMRTEPEVLGGAARSRRASPPRGAAS